MALVSISLSQLTNLFLIGDLNQILLSLNISYSMLVLSPQGWQDTGSNQEFAQLSLNINVENMASTVIFHAYRIKGDSTQIFVENLQLCSDSSNEIIWTSTFKKLLQDIALQTESTSGNNEWYHLNSVDYLVNYIDEQKRIATIYFFRKNYTRNK